MRRLGPRPLSTALGALRQDLAPATTLASVQQVWADAAGPGVAAEADPVSERAGTVTFACRSSVWANELTLMAADLTERLNASLEGSPVRELRFVTQASRRSS